MDNRVDFDQILSSHVYVRLCSNLGPQALFVMQRENQMGHGGATLT